MQLKINNLGIINSADIIIDGITVIAGKNDTGKSTISKCLYAMFNSFSQMEVKVKKILLERVKRTLDELLFINSINYDSSKSKEISEEIIKLFGDNNIVKNDIKDRIKASIYNSIGKKINLPSEMIDTIYNALTMNYNDYVRNIINNYFNTEFSNQINQFNSTDSANIIMTIKKKDNIVRFKNNSLIDCLEKIKLSKEVIYYDSEQDISAFNSRSLWDPYSSFDFYHVQDLINKLQLSKKNVYFGDNEVFDKFVSYFGNHEYNSMLLKGASVYVSNNKNQIAIDNLSSGAKVLVILKRLLQVDFFKKKNLVIFDEPETHLHPEWQINLAQALVYLQKKFELNILLSSHSPYFIGALDTYMRIEKISDKSNFYYFKRENGSVNVENVNNNLDKIYKDLDMPLDSIVNARESLNEI